jgi:long-chain fatty acid transport protein
MSLGITVFGNGGMNTDYKAGTMPAVGSGTCAGAFGVAGTGQNILCGNTQLGVDLMQLVIAPTVAYKVSGNHSIGISPLFGYQRFKAEGLQGFANFSADANSLTNKGYDNAHGWGARIGYMGKLSDMVTVGAAYSTKIDMSKFDKYKGLFAEQGDFDMPENWNVGISIKPIPSTTVAIDYQRINYSGVKSISNSMRQAADAPNTNIPNTLGPDNGRGFGWSDIEVLKLGVEHAYSEKLTLRAGYSHSDNPIQARDVTFNIIAPGVVTDHYTLGFTYALDKVSEITMSYMHAQENSVSGPSLYTTFLGANTGTETIKMYQDSLGIAYGMKF